MTVQKAKRTGQASANYFVDGTFGAKRAIVSGPPRLVRKIKVEWIDPTSVSDWDHLALSHPAATVFHSSAWARVLMRAYGHKPFYLRLSTGDRTDALLPLMEVRSRLTGRRGVCLPFSDCVSPLVFTPGVEGHLLGCVQKMTAERQWRYAEVRGSLEECAHELSQPSFFGHSLEFQGGEDALFANLEGSTRRAIRSATKNGLVVKVEGTEGALEDFYKLHVGTRKRHGAPPQPWRFFKAIQEELFTRGFGFVVSARDSGGKCLAAAVFLKWGKNALYKFGASNADALPLRPNHLVMWEAIRRLLAEGVTNLDFGRTSLDNKGLRRFKLSWGATERPIVYLRISGTKAQSLHARIMGESFSNRVFRALPATINRLAGAVLYKHLD